MVKKWNPESGIRNLEFEVEVRDLFFIF